MYTCYIGKNEITVARVWLLIYTKVNFINVIVLLYLLNQAVQNCKSI